MTSFKIPKMKKITVFILFMMFILRGSAQQKVVKTLPYKVPEKAILSEMSEWKLNFEDNFEKDSLNGAVWWVQEEVERDGLCYFTKRTKNVEIKEGSLVFSAYKEDFGNRSYTSGTTFFSQKLEPNVFVEISMRLPKGKGLWPAFWFWSGHDSIYQELDAVEFKGSKQNTFQISNHYWNEEQKKIMTHWVQFFPTLDNGEPIDITEGFHKYAVEWTKEYVNIYMDNILINKFIEDVPQLPLNLILGLGVGGIDGKPSSKTRWPARLLIDYVKIYKK